MTNPEILKLAKTCEFHYHKIWRHKGGKSDNQIHWECWEDQLLKFALLIHSYTQRPDGLRNRHQHSSVFC
jgi:hypothetical protein